MFVFSINNLYVSNRCTISLAPSKIDCEFEGTLSYTDELIILKHTVESFKFVGANFRGLSIFYRFMESQFRGLGGWGERKDNSGNVEFIWNELSFYTTDCDTGLFEIVYYKPLHDNWVIKIHNLVSQRPELNKSGFRKVGLLSYYWHY